MKSGQCELAWLLVAAAARMCVDLGWHRLTLHPKEPEILKKVTIFWHIYAMDKGMAFTLGRTPSIHQYDVATGRPSFRDVPGAPERYVVANSLLLPTLTSCSLYAGFLECAVIIGDMHIQLFSASAQRASQQDRTERAKAFASRLIQINNDMKQVCRALH